VAAALGVDLSPGLLELALTHRSYAFEHGGLPTNERLEFLGDSVLGLVVSESLYRRYPDLPEGQLARLRAAVVNARALAGIGRGLGLGEHLRLGRGEEASGGRDRSSILADTVEALFGAVFVEHGFVGATRVVGRLLDPMVTEAAATGAGLDWKTSLQELTARRGDGVPEYHVSDTGPDHAKVFRAAAVIAGAECGVGVGNSKKEAEQRAAEHAYTVLDGALPQSAAPVAGYGDESRDGDGAGPGDAVAAAGDGAS